MEISSDDQKGKRRSKSGDFSFHDETNISQLMADINALEMTLSDSSEDSDDFISKNYSISKIQNVINSNEEGPYSTNKKSIVAQIIDKRIYNANDAVFVQKISINNKLASYSLETSGNEFVKFVGKKMDNSSMFGFDYVVAEIDTKTGLALFRTTNLYQFGAKFISDSKEKKADYARDFNEKNEVEAEKMAKRWQLTSEFGNVKLAKRMKTKQDRKISNVTLVGMAENTMQPISNSLVKMEETVNAEQSPAIAMLRPSKSDILPQCDRTAETGKDVYSWDLFFSKEELHTLGPCAIQLLSENTTNQLIDKGYPSLIISAYSSHLSSHSKKPNPRRAVSVVFLCTLHYFYLKNSRKRLITVKDLSDFPMPSLFVDKLRMEFLGKAFVHEVRRKQQLKIPLNVAILDRVLCHLLVLALKVFSYSLPLTPWTTSLGISEMKVGKLFRALGCILVPANKQESIELQTVKIARLLGPPKQGASVRKPRRR